MLSKSVILVELAPDKPTAVDKLDIAVALEVKRVSSTATQALPLYLDCFLLSFVSNHKSPVCNTDPSGLAVGSAS